MKGTSTAQFGASRRSKFNQCWITRIAGLLIVASVLAVSAPAASAEAQGYANRDGRFQIGGGLGGVFSVFGDEAFSLGFDARYYFTQNISISPRLAFGFDSAYTMFFFLVDAFYHLDIKSANEALRKLVPFFGFGMGVDVIKPDRVDARAAFTIEFPFGVEYYLLDQFSLGTKMIFNIPVHQFGDNFFFQWQVITARYLF